jgi:hypothetical protein
MIKNLWNKLDRYMTVTEGPEFYGALILFLSLCLAAGYCSFLLAWAIVGTLGWWSVPAVVLTTSGGLILYGRITSK